MLIDNLVDWVQSIINADTVIVPGVCASHNASSTYAFHGHRYYFDHSLDEVTMEAKAVLARRPS